MSKHEYKPANVWIYSADVREHVMSKRHTEQLERFSEHTRCLQVLKAGDKFYGQNQDGNHQIRLDKSDMVLKIQPYDQYSIKIDRSGIITVRSSTFLRDFTPFNLSFGTLNLYNTQAGGKICPNGFPLEKFHPKPKEVSSGNFHPQETSQPRATTPQENSSLKKIYPWKILHSGELFVILYMRTE